MSETIYVPGVRLTETPWPMQLPGRFPALIQDGPGLAFSHSGLSHAQAMARLKVAEDTLDNSDPAHPTRRVRLVDPQAGLEATIEVVWYPAHGALVYGATLHNAGLRNIEHLQALYSYELLFAPLQELGVPRVHTLGGGVWENYYPTPAYRLREGWLLGPGGIVIDSGPTGRSSNKDLPFFLVEDGQGSSGIYGGIEWSGLWHINLTRRDEPDQVHYGHLGPDKSLHIQGGMDEVDLLLCTGETFCMPRVLLGFYEGPIASGRNAMRRFLEDWMPSFGDQPWTSPTQTSPGGYICPTEMTFDAQCRANIAAVAEIGIEYYIIENWFESLADRPLTFGATGAARGSWYPDPVRFPDLKGLADFTRAQGMKFGLWTDMEVAHAESRLAREHPDWVLYRDGNPNGLFNLALPAAQDWAIEVYDRLVEDYAVEWIFYDNNINPRPFWDANEPAHRHGRLQHDYIRGVWRVWDEVRRRHPDVIFENCSSGGRRIDLGTLARSHCSFTSDQFRDKHLIRYQYSGANTILPGSRLLNAVCKGLDSYPSYEWHANFGGMFNLSESVEHWSPQLKQEARQHLEVYKSIRRYLGKDFYPLFPQPQTLLDWDGWQFHDPATGEGFVLTFRVQSPQKTASPRLQALVPEAQYLVVNPYTDTERTIAGAELLSRGLSITLPVNGTVLLRYSRC